MQLFSFIILVFLNHIVTSVSSIDSDLFQYGPFCSLDLMSNIIQTIPSLDNIVKVSGRVHQNSPLQLLHVYPVQRCNLLFQLFPPSRLSDLLLHRRSVLLDLHHRPRLSTCCSDLAGMTCQDEFVVGQEESVFTTEECCASIMPSANTGVLERKRLASSFLSAVNSNLVSNHLADQTLAVGGRCTPCNC